MIILNHIHIYVQRKIEIIPHISIRTFFLFQPKGSYKSRFLYAGFYCKGETEGGGGGGNNNNDNNVYNNKIPQPE